MLQRICCYALALAVSTLIARAASDQPVTRGPYLQSGTPDSMVVRWRTEEPDTSVVRYGRAITNLNHTEESPGTMTEHVVLLEGLRNDTRYFYTFAVTNHGQRQWTATNSFMTAPPVGSRKPVRIWVLGDPGTKDTKQRAVRDAYARYALGKRTDLWLMLGDNAYDYGSERNYQKAVFDVYPEMLRSAVLWPTLGNHDARHAKSATQSGVYYDLFTLPTLGQAGGVPSGTEAYYSFDYANLHLICLNSCDVPRSTNGLMANWLRRDLAARRADWTIAFWHHPPYSDGSHDADDEKNSGGRMVDMREDFLPILEEVGVDLVLCGHSHSYERSFLLDGFYGKRGELGDVDKMNSGSGNPAQGQLYRKPTLGAAPHEGTVYAVVGSSGQTSGGKLKHPAMAVSLNVLGSMVIEVDGPRLEAFFLDDQARERDRFAIVKGR